MDEFQIPLQNNQQETREKPVSVPWGAWDVFAIIGLVIVVYVLMAMALGAAAQLAASLDPDIDLDKVLSTPLANSFMWLLQWSVTLGVAFTYLKWRGYQIRLSTLGFRKTSLRQASLLTFLVLFISFIFQGFYVTYVTEPTQEPVTALFGTTIFSFVVALVIVAMLTPVVEEMFFRGIIHQGLEHRFGFIPGALMSSAVFMLAHVDPTIFLPIFVLGFGFAWLMSRTRSVWPSIFAHFLWNALGVLVQFFLPNG